jgi:parvulin-like peptidyl-prolyl isomerase
VLKRWISEPLVQFVLIGALIFALYSLPGNQARSKTNNRINITAGEIEQLRAMFIKTRLRAPTEEELRGLIDASIQEEVFYREALAMGLDKDDTIVKRRLAQKLEFLTEDLSALDTPTDAQLAAFLAEHAERYQVPSRVSFVHVYFSTEKRGKRAEQDAKNDLVRLRAGSQAQSLDNMGDMFLLEYAYREAMPAEIEKVFGQSFAEDLLKLPEREWHGPLVSGYGLHLVKVDERQSAQAAALHAVREQVKRDWLDAQRRQMMQGALSKMRTRYQVVVDEKALRARVLAQNDRSEEGEP